jgi:hypothetical protein
MDHAEERNPQGESYVHLPLWRMCNKAILVKRNRVSGRYIAMLRKKIVGITLFYSLAYLIAYIMNPFLVSHLELSNTLASLLWIHIFTLVAMFSTVFAILKLSNENCTFSTFGIRKYNLGNSFLWAAAFSTPIPLLWFIGTLIVGVDTMLIAAKPSWASPPISLQILMSALVLWIMAGVLAFIFWETFPYEFLKDFPKKFVIPLIVVLWAGLYNTPLSTGKFDSFDVIFFGFLFTWAYHKTRNIIGILMAYLLNENPLWWTIVTFGSKTEMAFTASLILRMLICSISAFWIIRTETSKGTNKQR